MFFVGSGFGVGSNFWNVGFGGLLLGFEVGLGLGVWDEMVGVEVVGVGVVGVGVVEVEVIEFERLVVEVKFSIIFNSET